MKVVVTGGAGFIGSHIVEYWSGENADISVLDNLRSGYRKNLEGFKSVNFIEGSINDKSLVGEVLRRADYVFHLAAMVSVPESVENPYECVDVNVKGLLNVLEACVKNNVKKIVFSSSAAVYGDDPVLPKTVNLKPQPQSPYGITKLDGEYYLQMFNREYGLGAVSLRYFNVFGPRQDPKSQYAAAVPIFIYKALKNEDIIIHGDGEQTRDFIFVKDVVQANILAATNEKVNGVFNVANEKTITINELAKKIIEIAGSKSKIIYSEERPGDIKHSLASIKETREWLSFNPKHDLETALRETVEFFKRKAE